MPEDKIGDRLDESISQIQAIKTFIDELYENPKVATLANKPILSMLSTACDYLVVNLSQLRRGYMHETGK